MNIIFCFKLGKNASETRKILQQPYSGDPLSHSSILEWFRGFRDCRESLKDDPHTGRSDFWPNITS